MTSRQMPLNIRLGILKDLTKDIITSMESGVNSLNASIEKEKSRYNRLNNLYKTLLRDYQREIKNCEKIKLDNQNIVSQNDVILAERKRLISITDDGHRYLENKTIDLDRKIQEILRSDEIIIANENKRINNELDEIKKKFDAERSGISSLENQNAELAERGQKLDEVKRDLEYKLARYRPRVTETKVVTAPPMENISEYLGFIIDRLVEEADGKLDPKDFRKFTREISNLFHPDKCAKSIVQAKYFSVKLPSWWPVFVNWYRRYQENITIEMCQEIIRKFNAMISKILPTKRE